MESIVYLGLLALVVVALIAWGARRSARVSSPSPDTASDDSGSAPDSGDDSGTDHGKAVRLLELAVPAENFLQSAGQPSDCLGDANFERCVEYVNSSGFTDEELLGYYTGDRTLLAMLALEALARRDARPGILDPILKGINGVAFWTRFFALRCLSKNPGTGSQPLVGMVLATVDDSWDYPPPRQYLQEFVVERMKGGEVPSFGDHLERVGGEEAAFLLKFLPSLDREVTKPLVDELNEWNRRRIDVSMLNTIGRVWKEGDAAPGGDVIEHDLLLEAVTRAKETLLASTSRSVLFVGESGVGKTAAVRVLGRQLMQDGWTVFEAGHTDLMAGQMYIGQFEERLRELVKQLSGQRRVLWVIPDFHGLAVTGRHRYAPTSALDYLLPLVEAGEVTIVGETSPKSYERMIQEAPRCRAALVTLRLSPLDDESTQALAREWAEPFKHDDGTPLIPEETLEEAWNLTGQYLWSKAAPGNLLQFLGLTVQRLLAGGLPPGHQVNLDDLLLTLSQLTGLPIRILDERQGLDLDGLRSLFNRRVLGQPEAVDCLVERMAMIKAGVTDPTRPQGVFLFAGPTGTGKTEIAKTLAEFLFGSPERMIRFDMSEFQDPTALNRILGNPEDDKADALVDLIRNEPFSVVLLDEFEKAHWNVWTVFLQVFDDGRLSDRFGRTADFRHAIFILTSNLGSVIRSGAGVGFTEDSGKFSGHTVQQAIQRTFSREFINRLDRIIIFRPLTREIMREILRNELDAVFRRRGLRNRAWSVEWDGSALDFLLEKGFTPDMGARPLKRAVERHFLAPLADTIVRHQYPEGDQFLLVRRAGSKLAVEFIDPDATEPEAVEAPAPEAVADLRIEDLVLNPPGTRDVLGFLDAAYQKVRGFTESEEFREAKRTALAATSEPGFWNSPDRFVVLGRAEYLDRIESGVQSAGSLLGRLTGLSAGRRDRLPRDLVGRVAQTIYLIKQASPDALAEGSSDAFLQVEAGHDPARPSAENMEFARRLGRMYRRWAEKRGMRLDVLEETGTSRTYRLVLGISGFAAHSIIVAESGLHLMELPEDKGRRPARSSARVRVAVQPEVPPAQGSEGALEQARSALDAVETDTTVIVRRYREKPSPLVKDNIRGWRTGLLDRVLDGDFDLFVGSASVS